MTRSLSSNIQPHPPLGISAIVLLVLLLLVIGGIPSWPYSRNWGYGPSGIVGLILIILLIMVLLGYFEARSWT